MKIYVDIDETICYHKDEDSSKARDYTKAIPYMERIQKINDLYDKGHTIIYWTARGSITAKGVGGEASRTQNGQTSL